MKHLKKISLILFAGLLLFPLQTRANFTDVEANHQNKEAIDYLLDNEIVSGYPDGSFRPENTVNRAEFTKIIIGASLGINPEESAANCFTDVSADQWFASYVCYAKNADVIKGYDDGHFKPANTINLVEALKILTLSLNVETSTPEGEEWYSRYLEAMSREGYIPSGFHHLGQAVTRAQMAEMTWRILEEKKDQPHIEAEILTQEACLPLGEDLPSSINMDVVRDTWMQWYNEARAAEGLFAYQYNPQLNRSATNWSELAKDRGYMDHKRPGTTDYYDYWAITDWFKDLGLEFKNIYRVTHTENIGWGPYSCNASDCTQALLDSMRYSFDAYMAEKDQEYKAHYESVMNRYFTEIGLGVSIDESAKKMYLTVHYGTEITSDPLPVCSE